MEEVWGSVLISCSYLFRLERRFFSESLRSAIAMQIIFSCIMRNGVRSAKLCGLLHTAKVLQYSLTCYFTVSEMRYASSGSSVSEIR